MAAGVWGTAGVEEEDSVEVTEDMVILKHFNYIIHHF